VATTVAPVTSVKERTGTIWKSWIQPILVQILLVLAGLTFLFPFLWMISTALKVNTQIFIYPPVWIPNPIAFQNFPNAVTYIPYAKYFGNTLEISVIATIGTVASCSLVAYSLARLSGPAGTFSSS